MSVLRLRVAADRGRFRLDLALDLPLRGITAILGQSGSGKTSLLRCIAGLDRAAKGEIVVAGDVWQDPTSFVPPHRRRVGYVFQDAALFQHLTVAGNLRYAARRVPARMPGSGPSLADLAAMLGVERLLDRRVDGLSGGERQRVALARALLARPRLLLLDEPVAALDRAGRHDVLAHLATLRRTLPTPIIYVTHDPAELFHLADHLVVLEAGRVQAAGPFLDLMARIDLPLARLPDAGAVIEATLARLDAASGLAILEFAGGPLIVPAASLRDATAGTTRRVHVAASDVALARAAPTGTTILNILAARVIAAEPAGAHQVNVLLALGAAGDGSGLLARVTRQSWQMLDLAAGDAVYALVKAAALVA